MNTSSLRQRLRAREPLFGTFFKTPSHQLMEVLGGAGLDFVVIDAEHAPFDRATLDTCLLAARAHSLPALVRVRDNASANILDGLDLGAAGIVAPHACSTASIEAIIGATRYRGGTRGFSNSPRAGNYGLVSMTQHLDDSDRDSVVVCQIEDREAIERIGAIAAIDGADCLFIGRADLAVSYGVYDVDHPQVKAAVAAVCEAGAAAGKAIAIHIGNMREAQPYLDMGVSMFVVGSEQSVLRSAFADMRKQFNH